MKAQEYMLVFVMVTEMKLR